MDGELHFNKDFLLDLHTLSRLSEGENRRRIRLGKKQRAEEIDPAPPNRIPFVVANE